MTHQPPKQAGPLQKVSLAGQLLAWQRGEPVLVTLWGDSGRCCLPLFRTEEALRAVMAAFDIAFDNITRVDDEAEFLASVPELVIMADVRLTPEGRVRYLEVQR